MKTFKVILATLVIFCAGAFAGMMITKERQADPASSAPAVAEDLKGERRPGNRFEEDHNRRRQEFMARLQQDLNLSPEQYSQIESILDASDERTRAIWKPLKQQMHQEFQKVREQISATLNPEQQELYQEMMQRHRESKERQEDGKSKDDTEEAEGKKVCNSQYPDWQLWSQVSPDTGRCQFKEM